VVLTGTVAGMPAAGAAGRLYFPTNGYYVFEDTGSVWAPYGPIYPMTLPIDANFSWVLQTGGATSFTTNGALTISVGNGHGIKTMPIPSAPYTFSACISLTTFPSSSSSAFGLYLYNSGTQNASTFYFVSTNTSSFLQADKQTSQVSFNSSYASISPLYIHPLPINWLQIKDNGTTRFYNYSTDGFNWVTLFSVSNTDWLTPNEIGFRAQGNSSGNSFLNIISNTVTQP
jgi:hypothetical protein